VFALGAVRRPGLAPLLLAVVLGLWGCPSAAQGSGEPQPASFTYTSRVDGTGPLWADVAYVPDGQPKPLLAVMHGFAGDRALVAQDIRDLAVEGVFAVAPDMRGCGSSAGEFDGCGLQVCDLVDALTEAARLWPGEADAANLNVVGYSGGGGNAIAAAVRFPDLFQVVVSFFGISDYAYWYAHGATAADCGQMRAACGGDPALVPDAYAARCLVPAAGNNGCSSLRFFWDEEEQRCPPAMIEAFLDVYRLAGHSRATTHVSQVGDEHRWVHGYRSSKPDLAAADPIFLADVPTPPGSLELPPVGRLVVPGYLITRWFQVWVEDGRQGVVTVDYNLTGSLPQVTVVDNPYDLRVRIVDDPGNLPPWPPTDARIEPPVPRTTDRLVCIATGAVDPDGEPVAYHYCWYRNGVFQGGLTTDTVPAERTAKGDVWRCVVLPHDGKDEGMSRSAEVCVANSPPLTPALALSPPTPRSTEAIVAAVQAVPDPDGDWVKYGFRWIRDGASRQVTSGSATTDSLSASRTAKGQVWTCQAWAGDGEALSDLAEQTFVIGNSVPPTPRLTLTPTRPTSQDPLTAQVEPVRDPDGDPVRYGFRWLLDGVIRKPLSVGAALSSTLPAGHTAQGQVWTCQAWASDREEVGGQAEVRVAIANAPPPMPQLQISPADPAPGAAVHAEASPVVDPDGDPVTYLFGWARWGSSGWEQVRGRRRNTPSDDLPPGLTVNGGKWRCYVVASDGAARSPLAARQFAVGGTSPAAERGTAQVVALSAQPTALGAQVVFVLSAPAEVQVQVLNIAGLRVGLVTARRQLDAGTQTLLWNGRSDAGLPVPNGQYVVRVTARGEDGTASQALATLLIRR